MSLSEIKAQARAALHGAMAEPASYSFDGGTEYPTAEQIEAGLGLTVRWHTKMKIVGERDSTDVAFLEGVNRLIFSAEELDALGLTLQRNGVVVIPGYDKSLRLDSRGEPDGPQNVYWDVIEL
jgi:hypothetical protein